VVKTSRNLPSFFFLYIFSKGRFQALEMGKNNKRIAAGSSASTAKPAQATAAVRAAPNPPPPKNQKQQQQQQMAKGKSKENEGSRREAINETQLAQRKDKGKGKEKEKEKEKPNLLGKREPLPVTAPRDPYLIFLGVGDDDDDEGDSDDEENSDAESGDQVRLSFQFSSLQYPHGPPMLMQLFISFPFFDSRGLLMSTLSSSTSMRTTFTVSSTFSPSSLRRIWMSTS